jgi:hydroxymethylpyrimidine pyrophosphatase-like HAD family hydrolase
MINNFEDFLRWEDVSKDTIDVKRIYIDIANDLVAGILLSQIIYWNLPSKSGRTRLRVRKEGELWLAKKRDDWFNEIRITGKQYDRAIKILKQLNIVDVKLFKFNGNPTNHIKLNGSVLVDLLNEKERESRSSPKVKKEIYQTSDSLTENTTKNTNNNSKKEKDLEPSPSLKEKRKKEKEKSSAKKEKESYTLKDLEALKEKHKDILPYLNRMVNKFKPRYRPTTIKRKIQWIETVVEVTNPDNDISIDRLEFIVDWALNDERFWKGNFQSLLSLTNKDASGIMKVFKIEDQAPQQQKKITNFS